MKSVQEVIYELPDRVSIDKPPTFCPTSAHSVWFVYKDMNITCTSNTRGPPTAPLDIAHAEAVIMQSR